MLDVQPTGQLCILSDTMQHSQRILTSIVHDLSDQKKSFRLYRQLAFVCLSGIPWWRVYTFSTTQTSETILDNVYSLTHEVALSVSRRQGNCRVRAMKLPESETTEFLQFTETHSLYVSPACATRCIRTKSQEVASYFLLVASPMTSSDRHHVHAEPQRATG